MNWLRALEDAGTVDDVVDLVNDFLAQQPPSFWIGIPEKAQPSSIQDEVELHRWHHALVEQLTATQKVHVHLQDLCVFFVRASVRVHQLRLRAERPRSSNDLEFSALPRRRTRH